MSKQVEFTMPSEESSLGLLQEDIYFNDEFHHDLYNYQHRTGNIISEIRIRFNQNRGLKSCITVEGIDVILQSNGDKNE